MSCLFQRIHFPIILLQPMIQVDLIFSESNTQGKVVVHVAFIVVLEQA